MTTPAVEAFRLQRMRDYLVSVTNEMSVDAELEDALTFDTTLTSLVPNALSTGAWGQWLDRNRHGLNPFRRGIERLVAPLTTAELQWEGDTNEDGWTDADREKALPAIRKLESLIGPLALDLALKGKAGVLPWIQEGKPRVSLLSGFLFPVWNPFDVTELARLLTFQTVKGRNDRDEYLVWELEPGLVTIYEGVTEAINYQKGSKTEHPQGHARDRLPVAFAVLQRDANRAAEGYGEGALPALKQYRQRLLQLNAAFELVGMPQRVVTGMEGDETGSVSKFQPFSVIYLSDPNAKLDYPFPNHLDALQSACAEAAVQVGRMLHAPEPSQGAGESGESRMVAQEELVHAASTLGNTVADLLSDASELMAALGMLKGRLDFSLSPEFSSQRNAAQQNLVAFFEKGLLSKYEALTKLQVLGVDVSQAELDLALEERDRQKTPPDPYAIPPEMKAMQQAVMGGERDPEAAE
jgi:hypothetical protein